LTSQILWLKIRNQNRVRQSSCCGDGHRRSLLFATPIASGSTPRRQFQQFEPDLAYARMDQANLSSYAIGYINFASLLVRTAVIDANQLELAGPRIHHSDHRPKRQVGVGCGQSFTVKMFAVGGFLAVEPWAIPTGITDPRLYRLYRIAQMGNQGSLQHGRDDEHQEHPAHCSPENE